MSVKVVTLYEAFDNTKHNIFKNLGYEIVYVTALRPDLIFVEKDNASIEELESLDIVKSARDEMIGRLC